MTCFSANDRSLDTLYVANRIQSEPIYCVFGERQKEFKMIPKEWDAIAKEMSCIGHQTMRRAIMSGEV
jgi:hypothetical protein